MTEYIDTAMEAFLSDDASIAVFDRQSLIEERTWKSKNSVRVMELVRRFKAYDALIKPDGTLILPLHRENSAELSGDYIEYRPGGLTDTFVYFDSNDGKLSRVSPNSIGETHIAQRLRFWTEQYEPDSVPQYDKTSSKSLLSSSPLNEMDSSTVDDFFAGLRDFVSEQMEAERDEVRSRYRDQHLSQITRDIGGASELIHVGQRDTKHYTDVLVFGVATNNKNRKPSIDITEDYGIFPHVEAILGLNSASSPTDEMNTSLPIEATVAFTRGQYVGLSLRDPSELDQLESVLTDPRNTFCVVPLLNRIPYERELSGIDAVQQHERKRSVLCGRRTLEFR